MKDILSNNKAFLLPYLLFLIIGVILFIIFPKAELHLVLNFYHNDILDKLFYYLTWLGEWPPFLFIPLLLFIRYRYALLLLIGNVLSITVTQLLKLTLFSHALRPVEFYKGTNVHLKLVDGVENWLYNSFPSGHSTAAFSAFFCLALISKDQLNKFIFFIIALSVAYSRVYLSQHFFDDIYAGSIVGVTGMTIAYLIVMPSQRKWLDKALFKNRI